MEIQNIKFKQQLKLAVRDWLKARKIQYYTHVYAEINGKAMYLEEPEVRYLQIVCRDFIKDGHTLEEWHSMITIYSGPTKRRHKPMHFRKDGKFVEEFSGNGFFSTNAELAFELF